LWPHNPCRAAQPAQRQAKKKNTASRGCLDTARATLPHRVTVNRRFSHSAYKPTQLGIQKKIFFFCFCLFFFFFFFSPRHSGAGAGAPGSREFAAPARLFAPATYKHLCRRRREIFDPCALFCSAGRKILLPGALLEARVVGGKNPPQTNKNKKTAQKKKGRLFAGFRLSPCALTAANCPPGWYTNITPRRSAGQPTRETCPSVSGAWWCALGARGAPRARVLSGSDFFHTVNASVESAGWSRQHGGRGD